MSDVLGETDVNLEDEEELSPEEVEDDFDQSENIDIPEIEVNDDDDEKSDGGYRLSGDPDDFEYVARSISKSIPGPGHSYSIEVEESPSQEFNPPDGNEDDTNIEYGGEDYPFVDEEWTVSEKKETLDLSEDDDEVDETRKVIFMSPPQSTDDSSGPDEEEVEEEEEEVEETEPDFEQTVMLIPEEEAHQLIDTTAGSSVRQRDSILRYYPEAGETEGVPPSDEQYTSSSLSRMDRCPSIESMLRLKKSIQVYFYLYPGGKMISRDCRIDATVYQLKQAVSHFVQVPADHLDLRRKKNLVADNRTLVELGATARAKLKFSVEINKRIPGEWVMRLPKDKTLMEARQSQKTVTIQTAKGIQKVPVTILHAVDTQPKLGGYVDSRTGTTYLHASTTPERMDSDQWEVSDLHKTVQAFHDKNAFTQTRADFGQQMDRPDYYISRRLDKIKFARKYVTFEEKEAERIQAIITIQRYWRGWLARTERKHRMDGLIARINWAEKIRQGRIDQRYEIMEDEIRRQENPTRMVDIELLYRAINLWRKEQEEYVIKNRWGAERKAALAILTEMEADLLLDLERTRKRIKDSGHDHVIESHFSKMGKPKRWLGSKTDTFITLDSRERLNVRQLHHMYKELKCPVGEGDQGLKERFELLGRVNDMIKLNTSRLGVMLSDLITRELTYIRTNCPQSLMSTLRKRIANSFFLLCQDPLFNPEAKKLQKVPFDYSKLRKDMVQCKGCRRMQYRDEFTIQRGTTVTSRCHTCMGLYRTAILRVDLNLYRHMLDELRKDELAAGVSNSVTFLIDAFDLQFLVEQIWHGQSALSGIDNRYLLRLCRWVKGQPWTPWNCVLLTEEEAVSHLQLGNMNDAYRDSFFHKVFVKQCTAKSYFEGLAKLAVGLDDRIKEGCERFWNKEKLQRAMREKFKRKARLVKWMSISF